MIGKKDFIKLVTKWAETYAHETVFEPENNKEAVQCIISDYIEGAIAAYEYLNQ